MGVGIAYRVFMLDSFPAVAVLDMLDDWAVLCITATSSSICKFVCLEREKSR